MSFEVMGGFCETCPKRTYSRCTDCHTYACRGCQAVHNCPGHPFDRPVGLTDVLEHAKNQVAQLPEWMRRGPDKQEKPEGSEATGGAGAACEGCRLGWPAEHYHTCRGTAETCAVCGDIDCAPGQKVVAGE